MSEMHKAEARTEPIDSQLESSGKAKKKTEEASLLADAWRSLRKNPWFIISAVLLLLFLSMAVFPSLFTNTDPRECLLARSRQDPSAEFWFGTDVQGCDYYSRVIYGARNSIAVGFIVAIGTFIIAVLLGLVAGYFGGWVDAVISRLTDMVFAVPYILGALVLLNALQAFQAQGVREVAFVLIIFMWPTMTRLMRGSVISVVNSDFVMAARALGAGPITIMRRHILPNSLGPVIGYATVFTGIIIGAEATLTFLGVGLQLPAISWGLQLSDARQYLQTSPHLLLFPVIFVGLTVFAFMTMGDAVRDALDPKSKK
ncbi:ABC transporter permease [Nesterenkonia halotolerans]|uniref:Peptide/nickel transport system permease protein/oligopeptide transport system permease protein n=1 Tax=Nesterenkonia halotolerans TaxID=225325 RepID=A0ABR9J5D7_9MICC|nr:ABC transporter permease [Nesterenkonia halotolerans]MBE1514203.1 peptide/nickel transport system permease protein/oligopeptide transport system permease protein [Nesterenkonia halotolerans]